MSIPYFERAYAVDGYTRDKYNTHPALQRTAEQFSKATEEMVSFADNPLKMFDSFSENNIERHFIPLKYSFI